MRRRRGALAAVLDRCRLRLPRDPPAHGHGADGRDGRGRGHVRTGIRHRRPRRRGGQRAARPGPARQRLRHRLRGRPDGGAATGDGRRAGGGAPGVGLPGVRQRRARDRPGAGPGRHREVAAASARGGGHRSRIARRLPAAVALVGNDAGADGPGHLGAEVLRAAASGARVGADERHRGRPGGPAVGVPRRLRRRRAPGRGPVERPRLRGVGGGGQPRRWSAPARTRAPRSSAGPGR